MADPPVLLEHPSSLEHETGPHPEQPARVAAIDAELARLGGLGYERVLSPEVARDTLAAVHPESHTAAIEQLAAAGGGHIDADTLMSAGSYEAALHAAGGAVALVDLLASGRAPCGFSVHRPPGHHSERSRAMGFCLFNNVAVAARHALDAIGLRRVMILDWDVHHGNGTNDIFHEEPQVLFMSIHQWPLYPGTGRASDFGSGPGVNYTVNCPVAPDSGDEVFGSLVDGAAVDLIRAFAPELVLISAGFDAHVEDPLADCRVTDAGFAAMAGSVRDVCAELKVPVGAVLEGGYALGALARSVAATMEALAAPAQAVRPPAVITPELRALRERLAIRWPALAEAWG